MKKIAIFCVTYHSYRELALYLASIDKAVQYAGDKVEVEVFVADNTDKNIQPIEYQAQHFRLNAFVYGRNKGYFGAIGDLMRTADLAVYDYHIISNVDLVMQEDTLLCLADYTCANDTGWIAPQIYSELEKRDRNPKIMSRYSLRKLQMLEMLYRFPFLNWLYTKTMYKSKKLQSHEAGQIYAGHGSFIILTRHYHEHCGTINYPIFLFGEEIYLAERCLEKHLRVMYVPDIKVIDSEHTSTGKMTDSHYCRCNYEALRYITNIFY
ncbi:MAG: glycosyltransferase [Prevotellaceae bacterium]|nr:glycosyltransferase [Prevotellaceae bacterium]MDY6131413.1 glycosyltransferase [Prevotella sp.]